MARLTIDTRNARTEPGPESGVVRVTLIDPVIDPGDRFTILRHFDAKDVVSVIGENEILDTIGEAAARKHFGW